MSGQSPDTSVRVSNLRVDYGRRTALHGLSFDVPGGEIFGLLGPNGAGKTTAFRAMATLQEPTHGEITLAGRDVRREPDAARAILAYMPDLAPLPQDLRAEEYLRFVAECFGLWGAARDRQVEESLELVDLRERRRDFCRQLSLGMRQRLVLASSLLHRPLVLILDEPASGMDAYARAALRNALRAQAAQGTTVILSSHVLSELQDLCTSIGLLQAGRLVDAGPLREVLQRRGVGRRRLRLRTSGPADALLAWLAGPEGNLPGERVGAHEVECRFVANDEAQAAFFQRVGAAGVGVVAMREIDASIEDVVLGLHQAGETL
jgi:ABC-2 type transport system ATP-binding protein